MAAFEQSGQVIHVGETQEFGSNGFKKRDIVIEYAGGKDGQYTNLLAAQMVKDNCAKLDAVNGGDVVTLKCDVRSREYSGKYYTDVTCWAISVDTAGAAPVDEPEPVDDPLDALLIDRTYERDTVPLSPGCALASAW